MRGIWVIAGILSAAAAHAATYHLPPAETHCAVDGHSFPVHIAATVAERAQGFGEAPPALIEHAAILFVYPPQGAPITDSTFSFGGGANHPPSASVGWYFNMRQMLAPLDIAFMNDAGRVIAVLHMVPGQKLYRPKSPYAAALEIAAGRAAQLGLKRGAHLVCGRNASRENAH
ncbi:MAG TPA: DUF192 domain-containing protein [Gammaproteobacteria bacterium]|nr:DUF192 domain-containing protein [Gammaproteobacteria bacterium]